MTLEQLRAKVRDWDQQHTGDPTAKAKYGIILAELDYHAKKEWRVYLPAEHTDLDPSYMERLAAWVGNATSEDDQKLLLEYALCISFFSHDDFAALYRTAMDREITRWLAERIGARLDAPDIDAFRNAVYRQIHRHTWFCPVTDSMDINEFYKVNHLIGPGHRPGFHTLEMLANRAWYTDPYLGANIGRYMMNPSLSAADPAPSLDWLVLLEDIVGSAEQCLDAIRWAVSTIGKPVLFVPLILCPNGVAALRAEEQQSGGLLTVHPVIELQRGDLLGPERQGQQGWAITQAVEKFAIQSAAQIGIASSDAFGWRNTGCSFSTFSNTPDNSLPMIHHRPANHQWQPIFPRIRRE